MWHGPAVVMSIVGIVAAVEVNEFSVRTGVVVGFPSMMNNTYNCKYHSMNMYSMISYY